MQIEIYRHCAVCQGGKQKMLRCIETPFAVSFDWWSKQKKLVHLLEAHVQRLHGAEEDKSQRRWRPFSEKIWMIRTSDCAKATCVCVVTRRCWLCKEEKARIEDRPPRWVDLCKWYGLALGYGNRIIHYPTIHRYFLWIHSMGNASNTSSKQEWYFYRWTSMDLRLQIPSSKSHRIESSGGTVLSWDLLLLVLAGHVWMQYFFQELDDIGNSKPSWIQPGEVRNIPTVKSLLLSQIFWYFCYIFCFSFFLGQESYPYPCSWETSAKICEGFVTAWCKVVGFFDASGGDLLLHMEVENRTSGCLIVCSHMYIYIYMYKQTLYS